MWVSAGAKLAQQKLRTLSAASEELVDLETSKHWHFPCNNQVPKLFKETLKPPGTPSELKNYVLNSATLETQLSSYVADQPQVNISRMPRYSRASKPWMCIVCGRFPVYKYEINNQITAKHTLNSSFPSPPAPKPQQLPAEQHKTHENCQQEKNALSTELVQCLMCYSRDAADKSVEIQINLSCSCTRTSCCPSSVAEGYMSYMSTMPRHAAETQAHPQL